MASKDKDKMLAKDLEALKPSPEEIAEAKRLMSTACDKQKKSYMGCMVSWLKGRDSDDGKARGMLESRGPLHQEYLFNWLIHNSREKKKRTNIDRHVTSSKEAMKKMVESASTKQRTSLARLA